MGGTQGGRVGLSGVFHVLLAIMYRAEAEAVFVGPSAPIVPTYLPPSYYLTWVPARCRAVSRGRLPGHVCVWGLFFFSLSPLLFLLQCCVVHIVRNGAHGGI